MGTCIVGVIVAGLIVLAIRTIIKDKKKGKSCCGDCSHCSRSCH